MPKIRGAVDTVARFSHSLPPIPPSEETLARVQQLEPHAEDHVRRQHVVSKVILRQFREPVGIKRELLLAGLALEHPEREPRHGGPDMFGKFPDFVRFASKIIEGVWQETERKLQPVLKSVKIGTVFKSPEYAAVIREAVILHIVRSIPALAIHEIAWERNREAAREFLLQYPDMLRRICREHLGSDVANSSDALHTAIDHLLEDMVILKEQGAFFSVDLEARFNRYREAARNYGVEIASPKEGEYLISDVPALTVQDGEEIAGLANGIGLDFASEIILPLTPKHLAILRDDREISFSRISRAEVRRYNVMQIRNA